jgi:hypothetical protein
MLQNYIFIDIIKYILNLYIDYSNDAPKLENIILSESKKLLLPNTKLFDFKSHFYCNINAYCYGTFMNVDVLFDHNIIKRKTYQREKLLGEWKEIGDNIDLIKYSNIAIIQNVSIFIYLKTYLNHTEAHINITYPTYPTYSTYK